MINSIKSDVVIVGAGPVGLVAALGCQTLGLKTTVVETSRSASTAAEKGRSAALFNKTVTFLDKLGVWARCAESAQPLSGLQFIDDTGRRLRAPDCLFRADEIGAPAFGYNVANASLMNSLKAEAEQRQITILSPGQLASLRQTETSVTLTFESAPALEAGLAIAADGRTSATRAAAEIRALAWSYDQIAIATSFSHERPHGGVCVELHRKGGPFTLVPLQGNATSLVWVERKNEAKRLLTLDAAAFVAEIENVSRHCLGRVFDLSERAAFPISSMTAREYGRDRVALVGEAAHVTPPIGAQGLNLGFRDVEALVQLIAAAIERREDIGDARLLRDYSAARRGDIVSRTFVTDALNRSLLSDLGPLQAARSLGFYALGAVGPLRRALMRRGISPAGFV